jgi:hypothetical protein
VSNPTASNPFAWTNTLNPEEFIVKTTNILSGCVAYDTSYFTVSLPKPGTTYRTIYCSAGQFAVHTCQRQ